ncbi:phosphatase [[Phormidium ambiguum] IAM M-71]|uniref:Phosphatase n=1 Tax=[Phormidium ambiguum] IAM M-71 TaxID=454136 RepID=A0A1U7IT40_9CYAN|nr:HAD family hydrolase [Phormidium ambiguum]OKH40583.1 phosphatase [Phormidium ambiguum IAM M-71]
MTKLQALIFDVDGTLADTERDGHRIAFNKAFAEQGLDWHWSESLYGELLTIAGGKERIQYYLNQHHPNFQPPSEWSEFLANLHQLKTKHYRQLLESAAIPLRPGVKRLIKEAKAQGLRLAIATTSALPNVTALLEQTLDPECFEVIAAGDIVPAKKPAPDIYNFVLDKMGLNANECLVFEDSFHGLQAAVGAGLKTIVTINEYTKNHDFKAAYLVVNHLGELDLPCKFLGGNIPEVKTNYVNLDLLQLLHNPN